MRGLGIVVVVIGIAVMLFALGMDTSVRVSRYERVNNIGLMQERQNYLIFGGFAAVIGAIFVAATFVADARRPHPIPAHTIAPLTRRHAVQVSSAYDSDVRPVGAVRRDAGGGRGEPPVSKPALGHLADLEILEELRDRGILTADEFAAKKKQILAVTEDMSFADEQRDEPERLTSQDTTERSKQVARRPGKSVAIPLLLVGLLVAILGVALFSAFSHLLGTTTRLR